MRTDIDNFHHIGIITRDMPSVVARYEQLGFLFTPPSIPRVPLSADGAPQSLGVANRCAIFQTNYLEMLGIVDQPRWASIPKAPLGPYNIDPPLSRYEGLHVLHFASGDLDRTRDRLLAQGLQPSAIRPFHRLVETPDGERLMRARALAFPPANDPEALVQIAQHETPELALQPRYMSHPNGATAISKAILCVTDPDQVVAKYAAYTGHLCRREGTARVVAFGEASLIVVDLQGLTKILPSETPPTLPFFAGICLRAKLGRLGEVLNGRQIPFETVGNCLMIRANHACGASLLFEEASSDR
jgi:catechol 2,3-dioxygenase-like lactoylglutathione lyase family enzyme